MNINKSLLIVVALVAAVVYTQLAGKNGEDIQPVTARHMQVETPDFDEEFGRALEEFPDEHVRDEVKRVMESGELVVTGHPVGGNAPPIQFVASSANGRPVGVVVINERIWRMTAAQPRMRTMSVFHEYQHFRQWKSGQEAELFRMGLWTRFTEQQLEQFVHDEYEASILEARYAVQFGWQDESQMYLAYQRDGDDGVIELCNKVLHAIHGIPMSVLEECAHSYTGAA